MVETVKSDGGQQQLENLGWMTSQEKVRGRRTYENDLCDALRRRCGLTPRVSFAF